MKNTLAYIKINRMDSLSEQELLEGGKNTLVFLGIAPDDSEEDAIEKIKAFSTECQNSGFNVIAETVFKGSGRQAVRFLKNIIGKIKYIDCIVTPSINCFGTHPEPFAEVIEFMNSEGVCFYTPKEERLRRYSADVPRFAYKPQEWRKPWMKHIKSG